MTPAERQAKRREAFNAMRDALEAVCSARTVEEARALAAAVLPRRPAARPVPTMEELMAAGASVDPLPEAPEPASAGPGAANAPALAVARPEHRLEGSRRHPGVLRHQHAPSGGRRWPSACMTAQ
jgi:hypothetical protein